MIKFWTESKDIQHIILPYVSTPKGKEYYESTLDVCKSAFPQYIKEIQGMADGSNFPFQNFFILCLEKEIYNVLAPAAETDTGNGCTDVLVNSPQCKILGHNEDNFDFIYKLGYMVSARIVEDGEEIESFTSFCYPGCVPGHAISFNRYGMVFSSDWLYPLNIVEKAPPRNLLCRSVIKAKNIDEAITLLKSTGFGVAYGFTFNIVDVKDPSNMWSIEVGPQIGESKIHVYTLPEEADLFKPCHYIHTNSIEHLQGTPERPNLASSTSRRDRAYQMEPPRTKEGVKAILGDTTNQEFPIFRTSHVTSPSATIFTTVVDVIENKIDFYHGNPAKPGLLPSLRFQIKDGDN